MEILAQPLRKTVFTLTTFRHTKRLPIRISKPSHKKFHFKKASPGLWMLERCFIVKLLSVAIWRFFVHVLM
jgi:hypothetical protein